MWGKGANCQAVEEKKTSAMDWKNIRKKLKAGIGEPVSRFTGVVLDADGRWMR